jgi:hypothetical protein
MGHRPILLEHISECKDECNRKLYVTNEGLNETALSLSGSLFLSHDPEAEEEVPINVADINH